MTKFLLLVAALATVGVATDKRDERPMLVDANPKPTITWRPDQHVLDPHEQRPMLDKLGTRSIA